MSKLSSLLPYKNGSRVWIYSTYSEPNIYNHTPVEGIIFLEDINFDLLSVKVIIPEKQIEIGDFTISEIGRISEYIFSSQKIALLYRDTLIKKAIRYLIEAKKSIDKEIKSLQTKILIEKKTTIPIVKKKVVKNNKVVSKKKVIKKKGKQK